MLALNDITYPVGLDVLPRHHFVLRQTVISASICGVAVLTSGDGGWDLDPLPYHRADPVQYDNPDLTFGLFELGALCFPPGTTVSRRAARFQSSLRAQCRKLEFLIAAKKINFASSLNSALVYVRFENRWMVTCLLEPLRRCDGKPQ